MVSVDANMDGNVGNGGDEDDGRKEEENKEADR